MNKIFKQEWELYRQAGARPAFHGLAPKPSGMAFDGPVRIGEIRIFADMNRPFVALVLEAKGAFGYRLVPVSPFTVPASAREKLIGERVYQLWNVCTAAKSFVERSWLVGTLSADDVADLCTAIEKVASGAVSVDEMAQAYERAFRVAGGDFKAFWTEENSLTKPGWWCRRASWSIAAMLLICCGIGVLWREDMVSNRPVSEAHDNTLHEEAFQKSQGLPDECGHAKTEQVSSAGIQVDVPPRVPAPACLERPSGRETAKRRSAIDSVALIKSPVTMKSMYGCSRSCAEPPRRSPCVVEILPVRHGETYAEAAENEFLNPADSPLSTFGLDVDTSSYALMRSSLVDYRQLPAKDSVRIEEFVNYFRYDYPQPTGDVPVAVDCELAACPWNAKHCLLRLGVQAKKLDEAKLPPCNLTFLVDVSGSMMGEDRIELLKQALKMLVGKLRDEDHVAIVTYANDTAVRLPSVSGREKRAICEVIDGLVANGGTAGGDGIQRAYAEAQKNFDKKANNRVILVTDGDFNIGISSPKELEDFISEKRQSGIFLTVFGVGRGNYRDENMKKLATAGNGNYAYLDSLLEAKKVMLNEFGGTLMTVAKDVKVQIEFNPSEVEGYRLLGYENRKLEARDFNDDKKDAGEIGAGHSMTAFYEIIPAGAGEMTGSVDPLKYQKRLTGGKGEMFTVKTRYKRPDGDKSVLLQQAYAAADIARKEPSEDFRFASAVAEFALILKDSKFKSEASYARLIERARNAKGSDRDGLRAEFIRLAERAELLPKSLEKQKRRVKTSSAEVEVDI